MLYEVSLNQVLKFKFVMLLVTFATLAGTVYLYIIIPKGFFPAEDTGFISASTEAATDISFPALSELQDKVATIMRADPAGRIREFHHRTGWTESDPQYRPHVHRVEAAGRAAELDRDHPATARRYQRRSRHGDVLSERAEPERHRARVQERVPVHAAVEQYGGALSAR